jgi:hypothetical protein
MSKLIVYEEIYSQLYIALSSYTIIILDTCWNSRKVFTQSYSNGLKLIYSSSCCKHACSLPKYCDLNPAEVIIFEYEILLN